MSEHALNVQPANPRTSAIDALEAITRLQESLTNKAQKLEADLKKVDRLIEASTVEEIEDEPESEIAIPGSKKAVGLFPSSEFLHPLSPFYEEAKKRTKYLLDSRPRPMKAKESEALADAVKKENERLEAIRRSHISNADASTRIDLVNNVEGLDWERIAERVSDTSSVKRTSTECRITWVANRHPRINHSEWSPVELSQLNSFVSVYQQQNVAIDWVDVATKLGTNRIPIDCMRHGLPRQRLVWTPEADQRLITAVERYGIDNWQLVARNVSEDATATQCQARWQKSLDPILKRGTWTEQEDNQLRKAVAGYGMSWILVAAAVPGRTNDQCRERWLEHLATQVSWTKEDDEILVDAVNKLGNKWKEISKKIGNKTGPACRQRYDKLKRALKKQTPTEGPSVTGSSHSIPPVASSQIGPVVTPTPTISSEPASNTVEAYEFVHVDLPSVTTPPEAPLNPRDKQKEKELIQEDSLRGESQALPKTLTSLTTSQQTETGFPLSEMGPQVAGPIAIEKRRPRPRPKVLPRTESHNTEQVQLDTGELGTIIPPSSAATPDQNHPGPLHGGRKRKAVNTVAGDSSTAKKTRTTRSQTKSAAALMEGTPPPPSR